MVKRLRRERLQVTQIRRLGLRGFRFPFADPGLEFVEVGLRRGQLLAGGEEVFQFLLTVLGPERAELYLYPGDRHLFTDRSLPSSDPAATGLVVERVLAFLDRVDAGR